MIFHSPFYNKQRFGNFTVIRTRHLTISLTSLVAGLLLANVIVTQAIATPADEQSLQLAPMDQVNSVSQLFDVKPTDWAFQALQSLVERYGCIAAYPDKTYQGNSTLTRYEFAAGLNACIAHINELIAQGNYENKF